MPARRPDCLRTRMPVTLRLLHAVKLSAWRRPASYAGDWHSAHNALMNSSAHRAQILDSGYTQMGVGTAVDGDGTLWVAQVFRTPSGSSGGSGESTSGGGETTTGTTTSTGGYVPTVAPPPPTPEELLRASLRDARDKVAARQNARSANDPIVSVLDYTTVMDTLND
jgi:hypothetical protein